jgi:hypothetical protein
MTAGLYVEKEIVRTDSTTFMYNVTPSGTHSLQTMPSWSICAYGHVDLLEHLHAAPRVCQRNVLRRRDDNGPCIGLDAEPESQDMEALCKTTAASMAKGMPGLYDWTEA